MNTQNKHTVLENQNILLITNYSTNKNHKCHKIFTQAIMTKQVPAGLNLFIHKGILLYTLLTGAFLSIGFMTNFLSLKEMFLISLHGKPILGVSLQRGKVLIRSSKDVHFIYICPVSLNSVPFSLSHFITFIKQQQFKHILVDNFFLYTLFHQINKLHNEYVTWHCNRRNLEISICDFFYYH